MIPVPYEVDTLPGHTDHFGVSVDVDQGVMFSDIAASEGRVCTR